MNRRLFSQLRREIEVTGSPDAMEAYNELLGQYTQDNKITKFIGFQNPDRLAVNTMAATLKVLPALLVTVEKEILDEVVGRDMSVQSMKNSPNILGETGNKVINSIRDILGDSYTSYESPIKSYYGFRNEEDLNKIIN